MKQGRGLAASVALVLALVACKQERSSELVDSSPPLVADAAGDAAVRADAGAEADPEGHADKVRAWNDALTRKDTTALAAMYAPKDVLFYGTRGLARDAVVKAKKGYLAKHPDFAQTVADIHVKQWRATFAKTVTVGGKTTTYAAYLAFENGLIAVEGDETTDANRESARDAQRDAEAAKLAPNLVSVDDLCMDAVMDVVHAEMQRVGALCTRWAEASHDRSAHCGGMDQPPMPGQPTWTFERFIDHPGHIEAIAFVSVDLVRRTATEEGAVTEGEEKPLTFDPKAMDAAVATCAKFPPR